VRIGVLRSGTTVEAAGSSRGPVLCRERSPVRHSARTVTERGRQQLRPWKA